MVRQFIGLLVLFATAVSASAELSDVCTTIREPNSTEIYKKIGSSHFSDIRRSLPNLIVKAGGERSDTCVRVFYEDGSLATKMGAFIPSGSLYASRVYSGWGCGLRHTVRAARLRARAISKSETGSTKIYIRKSASSKLCLEIADPTSCINSTSC